MIMCKGLLSSVDYVRVESMSPSVESTCCPQHNLTPSNPLPLTPLSYPSLPPLPPSLPLAPYPSSPCPPVPPRPGPVLSFPGMNQSSYCKNFPGVNQSSSAKKRCHIEEESSRPHNDENIFSVRNWIEHNFQKSIQLRKISAKGTKLLFLPHLTATRLAPSRATKLHSADKLTIMHPAHGGNQVQTKYSTTFHICQWLSALVYEIGWCQMWENM